MAAGLVERAAYEVDLEAAHFVVEVDAVAHVERAGGGRERRGGHGLRGVCDVRRKTLARDLSARRDDDGALDDVLKLADVSGPTVLLHQREHFGRELVGHVARVLLVVLAYEVLGEWKDVFAPLAQRGKLDGHDGQTVVEVFAERALSHG